MFGRWRHVWQSLSRLARKPASDPEYYPQSCRWQFEHLVDRHKGCKPQQVPGSSFYVHGTYPPPFGRRAWLSNALPPLFIVFCRPPTVLVERHPVVKLILLFLYFRLVLDKIRRPQWKGGTYGMYMDSTMKSGSLDARLYSRCIRCPDRKPSKRLERAITSDFQTRNFDRLSSGDEHSLGTRRRIDSRRHGSGG